MGIVLFSSHNVKRMDLGVKTSRAHPFCSSQYFWNERRDKKNVKALINQEWKFCFKQNACSSSAEHPTSWVPKTHDWWVRAAGNHHHTTPVNHHESRRPTMTTRDRQIGLALLALGALLLLSNLSGGDAAWLWVGAIGAVFLYGYRARREPGLAVPGGVLAGVSAGILLESITPFDGIFLFGLAGGFYLISVLEPRLHSWALWPAGVLSVIAGLILISSNIWLFTALLIAGGLYLLNRGRQAAMPHPGHEVSAPSTQSDDAVRVRFDRLAAWRAQQASTENRMPTDVVRNDQLERIAREHPTSLEGLQTVLEPEQVERYGQRILENAR
jgi:hypothetical protein